MSTTRIQNGMMRKQAEQAETKLGPCARIVDEDDEMICNKPGYEEILVRNKFGLFAVVLCRGCRQDHHDFYEDERARENARKLTQPRGRITGDNPSRSNPGSRHYNSGSPAA